MTLLPRAYKKKSRCYSMGKQGCMPAGDHGTVTIVMHCQRSRGLTCSHSIGTCQRTFLGVLRPQGGFLYPPVDRHSFLFAAPRPVAFRSVGFPHLARLPQPRDWRLSDVIMLKSASMAAHTGSEYGLYFTLGCSLAQQVWRSGKSRSVLRYSEARLAQRNTAGWMRPMTSPTGPAQSRATLWAPRPMPASLLLSGTENTVRRIKEMQDIYPACLGSASSVPGEARNLSLRRAHWLHLHRPAQAWAHSYGRVFNMESARGAASQPIICPHKLSAILYFFYLESNARHHRVTTWQSDSGEGGNRDETLTGGQRWTYGLILGFHGAHRTRAVTLSAHAGSRPGCPLPPCLSGRTRVRSASQASIFIERYRSGYSSILSDDEPGSRVLGRGCRHRRLAAKRKLRSGQHNGFSYPGASHRTVYRHRGVQVEARIPNVRLFLPESRPWATHGLKMCPGSCESRTRPELRGCLTLLRRRSPCEARSQVQAQVAFLSSRARSWFSRKHCNSNHHRQPTHL